MTGEIAFFVPGVPIGQGSKTFVPTARGPRGRESNEAKLKPWRASIVECAPELADGPIATPVSARVIFIFPRPKSHYRTGRFAHELRESAPIWHVSKPDTDKLLRALGDALTGVVLADDSLIASWAAKKLYGSRPGALIEIAALDDEDVL